MTWTSAWVSSHQAKTLFYSFHPNTSAIIHPLSSLQCCWFLFWNLRQIVSFSPVPWEKSLHWEQSSKSPYILYQHLETHLLLSSSPQTLFKTLSLSSSHRIRVQLLSWGTEDSHCLVSKSFFVLSSVTSLNLYWLICETIFSTFPSEIKSVMIWHSLWTSSMHPQLVQQQAHHGSDSAHCFQATLEPQGVMLSLQAYSWASP